MNPDHTQWADDATVLAEIGRALISQPTRVTVRIPRDLADAAVAAWERDDGESGVEGETLEQATTRVRAAHLALIGLAISGQGQRADAEVVVELDAWDIGAAYEAADAMGALDGVHPPPPPS